MQLYIEKSDKKCYSKILTISDLWKLNIILFRALYLFYNKS